MRIELNREWIEKCKIMSPQEMWSSPKSVHMNCIYKLRVYHQLEYKEYAYYLVTNSYMRNNNINQIADDTNYNRE